MRICFIYKTVTNQLHHFLSYAEHGGDPEGEDDHCEDVGLEYHATKVGWVDVNVEHEVRRHQHSNLPRARCLKAHPQLRHLLSPGTKFYFIICQKYNLLNFSPIFGERNEMSELYNLKLLSF